MDRACRAGTDLVTMWRTTAALLAVAVPHFESPCFFTVDPDSLLTTSHFQEGLPEIPADWLGREYLEPDFNSMTEVLASREGFGTLHDATGGRPELASKYHREMQPNGCDQELVVALRTRDGETWGALGLYREAGRPLFAGREIDVVRAAAPMLAEGARHARCRRRRPNPTCPTRRVWWCSMTTSRPCRCPRRHGPGSPARRGRDVATALGDGGGRNRPRPEPGVGNRARGHRQGRLAHASGCSARRGRHTTGRSGDRVSPTSPPGR